MRIKKTTEFHLIVKFLEENFSSPTHWPEWNILVSSFYNTVFFYYCACEDNEIIGVLPVHKKKKGLLNILYSGQFWYIPYGGWIFSKRINLNSYKQLIDKISSLTVFQLPLLEDFNISLQKKNLKYYKTLILRLDEEMESIWLNHINSKKRNKIRKAQKNNILIEYNERFTNSFYLLYKNACTKNKLKLLPWDFFLELNNSNHIKFLIITALKGKTPLANIVIVYDKNYAIYWLGNQVDNSPNLGQGELLQWEAIKKMKDYGCKFYDLCYIDEKILPHIYEFKSSFSKIEIDVPLINIKPVLFRVVNKLSNLF